MEKRSALRSLAVAALLLCIAPAGSAQHDPARNGALELRQITYSVAELEKTARFLTDVFGWKRRRSGPRGAGGSGGRGSAFIDAGGVWIELRPRSDAPSENAFHAKETPGAIVALSFSTHEYDPALATRVSWYPQELTGATRIGVVDATSAPAARTAHAQPARADARDRWVPRVSHVALLVGDLEKAASFYGGVMNLARSPKIFEIGVAENPEIGAMKLNFIHAGRASLELVQPAGPGPITDALALEGDGAAAELVVEVDDLAGYFDHLGSRGIFLVDIDGKRFTGDRKFRAIDPFGTKIAYLPTEATQGMVIEIIERGPRETDILHVRDAAWPK